MSFKLQQREEKGVLVLTLHGSLDASYVPSFKKECGLFSHKDSQKILMDCSSLDFIDSTGLGALLSLLRKLEAKQGRLVFSHLSSEVASIFEITRLHKLFEVFPNNAMALQSLNSVS